MKSYETLRRVGRGHHGTAWLVRDVRDGRHYCLKTINLQSYDDTERSQAAGEVSLLRSLDHPCIVRYREHFLNSEGMLCLVMTFCEGGDLASAIRAQKETGALFGENQVLDWFAQLALALGHTHERRILHRDIKTQNVFLSRGSLVKLGDFGIARVLDGSHSHAQTVVGTPFYMSPEVCQNRPYSYKSDVWALGCVLYELLALRQAWDGSNLLGLVYKIVQQTYEPPPAHYSPELRALLAAMLAKEPDARPSVAQILNEPMVPLCNTRRCP
jgi:NIMA (never in mitosis gene a)-related kinase